MQQPSAPYGAPAVLPPPPVMPAYVPQPAPLQQPAAALHVRLHSTLSPLSSSMLTTHQADLE